MPVTAKLSRSFYDRLGDNLADALVEWFNQVDATYRGDLRQLNELNFSRFDASVWERFAVSELKFMELDARMEKRFTQPEARMDKRLSELDLALHHRFDVLQWRMFGILAAQFALIAGLYLR
jgi:hypothetical protein